MPVAAAHLGSSFKGCAHVLTTPYPPVFRETHHVWVSDVVCSENMLGFRVVWATGMRNAVFTGHSIPAHKDNLSADNLFA